MLRFDFLISRKFGESIDRFDKEIIEIWIFKWNTSGLKFRQANQGLRSKQVSKPKATIKPKKEKQNKNTLYDRFVFLVQNWVVGDPGKTKWSTDTSCIYILILTIFAYEVFNLSNTVLRPYIEKTFSPELRLIFPWVVSF